MKAERSGLSISFRLKTSEWKLQILNRSDGILLDFSAKVLFISH